MPAVRPLLRTRPAPDGADGAERTAFATIVFLVLFFGDALRNSINWGGWGAVCVVMVVASVILVVRNRHRIPANRLPLLLGVFLAYLTLSILWSDYPLGSALGIATQLMTTVAPLAIVATTSWEGIVTALGRALRAIVVLSLLFELVVALFVRQPFCPVYVDCSGAHPAAFYWTRDNLFTGGQIQGLPGNSNLLAIFALLALIVTALQASAGSINRRMAWLGIVSSILALGLTRSSTVLACLVVTAVVLGLALLARRLRLERRWLVGVAAIVIAALVAVVVAVGHTRILRLLDKSPDLTGRTTIWKDVYDLAIQRPIAGWGWTGWWQPAYSPFKDLAERNGVVYLQAHDAYLDVFFQLGWIGLVLFLAVLVTTTARSWWWATDRRMLGASSPAPWSSLDLVPLLVMACMLTHALGESRLNVEWGWGLLITVCLSTRLDNFRWWTAPREPVPAA
ncbi:O-antigen ligase family protein [Frondihabitans australicus]|uniref:O-antigen ligase n=1 Tax=Frondihabitans australicus TaxID=386892 RepID=A0A495IB78_9MICO|nr:O-antigen ligase family protein [Frondihabitans australicus]RKR73254.1 O-antigen ligase [Frondihabitans australicus]